MELTARPPVAVLGDDARAAFITRTYLHLFGAILLFVGIQFLIFSSGLARPMYKAMMSVNWLLVLGAFMIVGTFADRVAARAQSKAAQYGALLAFVAAEAIIFVPLLYMAATFSPDPGVIGKAAWVTLLGFGGLTAVSVHDGEGLFLSRRPSQVGVHRRDRRDRRRRPVRLRAGRRGSRSR